MDEEKLKQETAEETKAAETEQKEPQAAETATGNCTAKAGRVYRRLRPKARSSFPPSSSSR